MGQIAILGGGLTGLTAALALARAGHAVTVYERRDRWGGLASTLRRDGYAFDLGPREFRTADPAVETLVRELAGPDLLRCGKETAEHFFGAWVRHPLRPLDLLRHVRKGLLARILLESFGGRLRQFFFTEYDYTFRHWVESRFGPTLYREYFAPYTRKVWGIDPESLDWRTASSRIAFNSLFDYARRAGRYFLLGREDRAAAHSPLRGEFLYFRGGLGRLAERLQEEGEKCGAVYRAGHELESIDLAGDHAHTLRFRNGETAENFDRVVSTIPLTRLIGALGHAEELLPLLYRGMLFVHLALPRRPVSPHVWSYFGDPGILFQRVTEFTHLDPEAAPPGATGLCCEIACFAGDELWSLPEEELVARVRRDLAAVGLVAEAEAASATVAREEAAYPVQVAGHLELVESILTPIREIPNLSTLGRQGLYRYCNMDECMSMALEEARRIGPAR